MTDSIRDTAHFLKGLNRTLECPVCLEASTECRSLPCQHWVCRPCLTKMFACARSAEFACPVCKQKAQVPVAGEFPFPSAFIINTVVEKVDLMQKHRAKEAVLCPVEGHGLPVELFCTGECQKLVCSVCCQEKHKGHTKVHFQEIIDEKRESLNRIQSKVEDKIKECESQLNLQQNSRSTCEQLVESQKQSIENHGQEIISMVKAAVISMKQEVDKHASVVYGEFKRKEQEITERFSELGNCKSRIEKSKEHGGYAKIIQTAQNEMEEFTELTRDLETEMPSLRTTVQLSDLSGVTDKMLLGTVHITQEESKVDAIVQPDIAAVSVKKVNQFNITYLTAGIDCTADDKVALCGYEWPGKLHIHGFDGHEFNTINSPTTLKTAFYFTNAMFKPSSSIEIWDVACSRYNIYVTDSAPRSGQVHVYSIEGTHTNAIHVGYKGKAGICLTDDHMYITSQRENVVYKLDMPVGGNQKVFIERSEGLAEPLFISTNGRYLAVSSNGNHRVFLYNLDGEQLFVYGRYGDEPGLLNHPWGVVIDQLDRVIVSDSGNNRICIVSKTGQHMHDEYLAEGGLEHPRGISLSRRDQIVVACRHAVAIFDYTSV